MQAIVAFLWAAIWPVLKNDILEFLKKYQEDAAFRSQIDQAVKAVETSSSPQEKSDASALLQKAMSRRGA